MFILTSLVILAILDIILNTFVPHIFLIGGTMLFFIYKKFFKNKKSIYIFRAIDFKINSLLDFYYSIIILLLYGSIFFIGIIILRLKNWGNSVDLWEMILKLKNMLVTQSHIYILIYITTFLCILIWLIILLKYIHKLVRFHANRLHILFCEKDIDATPYKKIPHFALDMYHYVSMGFYSKFARKVSVKYRTKIFPRLLSLEENFALFLLFGGFIYDIIFNNFTLYYIFYLLPFILIYKVYRDFLNFYCSRLYFDNYDCAIYCIIYQESLLDLDLEEFNVIKLERYIQNNFKRLANNEAY